MNHASRSGSALSIPFALAVSAGIACFTMVACSETEGASVPDAEAADGGARTDGGGVSAEASRDATASFDAAALPQGLASCGTCMQSTCAPEVSACLADTLCSSLVTCAFESGCLTAGGQDAVKACVTECGKKSGATPRELAAATVMLSDVATSCGSCLTACPIPDAGLRD